jgi:hypothetical protein
MKKASLLIKCWKCGQEETVKELLNDNVVEINLDKFCTNCNQGWMIKKELTIEAVRP